MSSDRVKILVVEDDLFARTILSDALDKFGYDVSQAGNGVEALELCKTQLFHIIITDWVMPEMDGIELCRALRAMPSEQYQFILLLTSLDKKDQLITGLDAGADEYLVKPFHEVELAARLKAAQRILDLESSLKSLAQHDQLTGAYNRGYLDKHLAKEIQRSWRYNHPLSVVMCDIDHFKLVNDTHGHQAGDQVLKDFVSQVSRSIRNENDWVARYGGEEFVLVLPETPPAGCVIVAERIRKLIESTSVPVTGGSVSVTVSFGALTIENTSVMEEMSMAVILSKADECLYRAKETGRNRVVAVQF